MNACIIAYTFYEVDFRVRRYADALASAGYDVDVFALKRKGESKRSILDGVTIHHLQEREYNERGLRSYLFRMGLFFGKVFFTTLAKQIRSRYKIVHVHNPPDFLVFSVLISKILGAKIIFDMHENLPEFYCAKFKKDPDSFLVKILLFLEKIATKFADFTIVAHDLLRKRVIKRDKIEENKCVALLNYPPKSSLKRRLSKKNERVFKLIYPGTVSHQHGIDIAIKAMAIVREEVNSIKFDIYGKPNSIVYYQDLEKLIDALDLKEHVLFHGLVPYEEIQGKLTEASIGIVPKRGGIFGSEAFSTKILEFMNAGLPVVVSKTKIDEYYFDSSVVMFFEPEDPVALSRCILELYRNGEKRKALAKKGREFIRNNTWESKSQIYLDIVRELVGTAENQKVIDID